MIENRENWQIGNTRVLTKIERTLEEKSKIFLRSVNTSLKNIIYSFYYESFDDNCYSHLILKDSNGKEVAGVEYDFNNKLFFPIEGFSNILQKRYFDYLRDTFSKEIFN